MGRNQREDFINRSAVPAGESGQQPPEFFRRGQIFNNVSFAKGEKGLFAEVNLPGSQRKAKLIPRKTWTPEPGQAYEVEILTLVRPPKAANNFVAIWECTSTEKRNQDFERIIAGKLKQQRTLLERRKTSADET